MNLIIDIGNSRIKFGIFEADKLLYTGFLPAINAAEILRIQQLYPFQKVMLSSVAILPEAIETFFSKDIELKIFSHQSPIPIKNQYQTPETLGRDRLAGVCGAYALFPNENSLVIDAGTCITYDFINDKNEYKGGSISPGLEMRFKALHTFTSALPLIGADKDFQNGYGNNTATSILSGVQNGLLQEIQGFISYYMEQYQLENIILCGGDASFLATHIKNRIFVAPDLVLTGLNEILNYEYPKH